MKELLGGLGVVLAFAIYLPYFRDIIRRKTTPHPFSWIVWTVTTILLVGMLLAEGAGPAVWSTVATAIVCIIVTVLSFMYEGHQHIRRIDVFMLAMAGVAMVLWLLADQPLMAALLLIVTDLLGMIPTFRKSWKHPYSETLSLWSLSVVRQLVALAALTAYTSVTVITPIVWIVINGSLALMLVYRRKRVHERKPSPRKTRRTRR